MRFCWLGIHRWSRWSDPFQVIVFFWKQQRTCKYCNRIETICIGPSILEEEDV